MRMQQSRVLIPIARKFFWLAKYIVCHPLKAFFFIIKFYLSLLLLVFCLTAAFSAVANIQITEGLDIDGHLFHISNGLAQKSESTIVAVTNDMHNGGDPGNAISAYCSAYEQSDRNPIVSGCSIQSSSVANSVLTGQCSCGYTDGRFDPPAWTVIHEVAVQVASVTVYSCPPQNKPYYTVTVTQSEISMCFDPLDLSNRDSCPKSPSSPDFMLPPDGSGNARVCNQRDDGSMCAYDMSSDGEYYTPNFEANCYDGDIPMFDDSAFSDIADNDPQTTCEDIGNGVLACAEDPANVCDGFSCMEGCGFFGLGTQTEFICLSGDMDGDNVADYADPDVDGDGIPNEQDLDSDGDGVDDPVYANNGSGTTVNVAFDDAGIISAISAQTNQLGQKLDDIENNLGPGGAIDFSVPQEIIDLTEPNDYQTKNYGTVMEDAVNRMKEAPLFSAVDGFFDVSFSGECPIYSAYIAYMDYNLVIDQLCSPVMNNIWPIIQSVVILCFSFMAFRVAIL